MGAAPQAATGLSGGFAPWACRFQSGAKELKGETTAKEAAGAIAEPATVATGDGAIAESAGTPLIE